MSSWYPYCFLLEFLWAVSIPFADKGKNQLSCTFFLSLMTHKNECFFFDFYARHVWGTLIVHLDSIPTSNQVLYTGEKISLISGLRSHTH